MDNLTLGLLIWALVATAVCLFNFGAAMDHKGPKAKFDAEKHKAWAYRLLAKHLQ